MATRKTARTTAQTLQDMRPPVITKAPATPTAKSAKPSAQAAAPCNDTCSLSAYQAWRSINLPAAFVAMVSFTVPAGKRFVIELVTATINVPAGEYVRLRMYTAFSGLVSNMDLFVTPQGTFGGQAAFIATHALRAYADTLLEFNISRSNGSTTGSALICVSGYLVTL